MGRSRRAADVAGAPDAGAGAQCLHRERGPRRGVDAGAIPPVAAPVPQRRHRRTGAPPLGGGRAGAVDRRGHTFRAAGAVRVRCTAAYKLHEQRPRFSYDVAMEAWKIATQLPEDHPLRRVCLGLALRGQATALRYLGRFAEALEALDKAETLARGTPSADVFDLALVWTIRATVYLESERPADALPLAQAAARVFRDYGDEYRECAAAIFEASSHLLMGAPDRAARAFERVIVSAEKRHDNVVLASAMNNAAVAYADLGQLDRAAGYYAKAIALDVEGQRT